MIDTVTIVGRVATDPTLGQTASGVPVTNFRLASTHRRFDASSQAWIDAGTNWFSVAAFRQLGEHTKASLRTGDSVIVTGRLKIRDWESNGRHGTSVDIEADAIGHDLRWGTTAYRPQPRTAAPSATATMTPTSAVRAGSEDGGADDEERAVDSTVEGMLADGAGEAQAPLDLSWATPAPEESLASAR